MQVTQEGACGRQMQYLEGNPFTRSGCCFFTQPTTYFLLSNSLNIFLILKTSLHSTVNSYNSHYITFPLVCLSSRNPHSDLWTEFFHTLLNVPDCSSLPCLRSLRSRLSTVLQQNYSNKLPSLKTRLVIQVLESRTARR